MQDDKLFSFRLTEKQWHMDGSRQHLTVLFRWGQRLVLLSLISAHALGWW